MMIRPFLAACGLLAAAGTAMAQEDLVAAGEKVFRKCQACHAVGEGATHRVGPMLNELFGRVAGSLPDYGYSEAMVQAGQNGLVWTDASLAAFVENPREYVPGTKMVFPGLKREEERAAVIAYLKTFDTDGLPEEGANTYQPPTQ